MNSLKPIISLTIFGGAAPELAPSDLPAGPAVIAEDVDFDSIGAVRTRDGIQNQVNYLDNTDTEHAATGTTIAPGVAWVNATNITLNNPSTPATVTLNGFQPDGFDTNSFGTGGSGTIPLILATSANATDFGLAMWGTNGFGTSFGTTNAGWTDPVGIFDGIQGLVINTAVPAGTVTVDSTVFANTSSLTECGLLTTILTKGVPVATLIASTGSSISTSPVTTGGGVGVVTAGQSILIAVFGAEGGFDNFTSYNTPTDNHNNVYTLIGKIIGPTAFLSPNTLGCTCWLWQCSNPVIASDYTFSITTPGNGAITASTISGVGGINYAPGDTGTINGGVGGTYVINSVSSGHVTGYTITNAGHSYPNDLVGTAPGGAQPGVGSSLLLQLSTGTPFLQNVAVLGVTNLTTVASSISQELNSTYEFAVPPGTEVTGLELIVSGNQTGLDSTSFLTATLVGTTLPVPVQTFQLPLSNGAVTVGADSPLWGQLGFTPEQLNSGVIGVNLQADAAVLATFSIYDVTLKALLTPVPPQNFNYVKTFEQTDGTTLNLALDASGTFYQEDLANPGVLTAFYKLIEPGTFATSVSVDDREFIALSDLKAGSDMPRQYDGTNFNRLSQVGPGAPPAIGQATSAATLSAAANASAGNTTYTGVFNPAVPVGISVTISGFSSSVNNGTFTVVSCSSTSLVVNNAAGTSETHTGVVTYVGQANTIVSITQAAPVSIRRAFFGASMGDEFTPGNIITFFGQGKIPNTTNPSISATLPGIEVGSVVTIVVVNSGSPVGGSSGGPLAATVGGTYTVLQVGTANIGGSEIAPCFSVTSNTGIGNGRTSDYASTAELATYQTTTSTVTVANPIPNLGAGQNITIAGTNTAGYNGTFNVTGELNGGQMSITNTALASNVATYTYTVTAGEAIGWQPTTVYALGVEIIDQHGFVQQVTQAGTSGGSIPNFSQTVGATTDDPTIADVIWTNQGTPGSTTAGTFGLVTVTGCTNGTTSISNPFNVTNAQVTSATATTFTVNVINSNIPSGPESGAVAVINGTIFTIDTGKLLSDSTGGTIVSQGGLASGTRQAVCLFQTEAGLITQCSVPVEFNLSADSQAIICSQIPTGPSNVVSRIIAFTEAGQQGVPGAFFYYIPKDVTTVSPFNANQQITYTATVVPNNTQTTATFSFTDAVLLSSTEIDIEGANNFNQVELGSSLGLTVFGNRVMAWGVQSKITNLINYSFDGGTQGGVAAIVGDTTYTVTLIQATQASSPTASFSTSALQHCSGSVHNGGSGSETLTINFPSALGVGNTIIMGVTAFHYGSAPSITDTQGNSYSLVGSDTNGEVLTYLYAAYNVKAGSTSVTLRMTGAQFNSFLVADASEHTGIQANSVDKINSAHASSGTTFNTGSVITNNPNDIIVSFVINDLAAGTTPGLPSGYTSAGSQSVPQPNGLNGSVPVAALAWKTLTSAGSNSPVWSASTFSGSGITAAFKLAPVFTYGQTTLVKAFTKSVTNGNGILVTVEAFDYVTGTTITVTDSQSNTYTKVNTAANAPSTSYVFYTKATGTNALTITITMSAANTDSYLMASYSEFNGLLVPLATDGTNTNVGTFTNNFSTGQIAAAGPSVLVLSTVSAVGGLNIPLGYSSLGQVSVPTSQTLSTAYFVTTTAGSYEPIWTRSGLITGNGNTVAFSLTPSTAGNVSNNTGVPLGWSFDPVFGAGGSVGDSPIFGSAYIIANSTGSTQSTYGMITQPAYQDYLLVPIIQIQQKYSIRVTAANVGGSTSGNLVVDLFSPSTGVNGTQYPGAAVIPLASMTPQMVIFDETLLSTIFPTFVPTDLQIRIYATALPDGAKVYIDRIEPFLTAQPLIDGGTSFLASYQNNFEAFDLQTGRLGMATENQQPIRTAFTLFDQLVGVKSRSMYSTTDNGTTEPGLWTVREISNKVGTPSVHGVAIGEGWAVIADQAGLFIYDGGQPKKISGEIQPVWDYINWAYGHTLWVTNDVTKKRICIGVPIPTPNMWMPDFPVNANPTSPNVVLMLSYRELNSAQELASEGAIRQTFVGTLKAYQLGRKWAWWNIQSPYAALCDRADTTQKLLYCNGLGNSRIYQQEDGIFNDDGSAILSRYMTYGFPKSDEAEAKQLGLHRYLATFATFDVTGNGLLQVKTYPDNPTSDRVAVSTPQQLHNPSPYGDLELPLQRSGFRFFIDISTDAVDEWFQLSRLNLSLSKEPFSTTRGGNF